MIKLSVVIITFNEEENIRRCIKAAQGIADEILVVDSYSKDATKEICDNLKVRFVEHKFEGHIQQKNYAASIAEYNHVLSLDADEVLSEELYESIKKVKSNFEADGYTFNRLTNYNGSWVRHCGWYPDVKLRLWDRRKGEWCGENPHDRYELSEGSNVKHLKSDLLHYSYNSIYQHINQVNSFTEIGAKAAFLKGKRSNVFKITIYPLWKFIKDYFFNKGFLDGYTGFVICIISAHATFVKYIKIKELTNKNVG